MSEAAASQRKKRIDQPHQENHSDDDLKDDPSIGEWRWERNDRNDPPSNRSHKADNQKRN